MNTNVDRLTNLLPNNNIILNNPLSSLKLEAKFNENLQELEIKSNKQTLNFYTPNKGTLSKICFVDIKNPRLEGSAFYFKTGIEVGVNTILGFATGLYTYIDNEKYIEIEVLPNLLIKYNYPDAILNKRLPGHIEYWFKQKKSRKGQTLLLQTPQICFVKETDISYITSTGLVYDYIDDEPIELNDTPNSVYNDEDDQEAIYAKIKCTHADFYVENSAKQLIKVKRIYGKGRILGVLSGTYKTYQGKDYLQIIDDNSNSYYWIKKVAANIIVENENITPIFKKEDTDNSSSQSNSTLLLGLATLLFIGQ